MYTSSGRVASVRPEIHVQMGTYERCHEYSFCRYLETIGNHDRVLRRVRMRVKHFGHPVMEDEYIVLATGTNLNRAEVTHLVNNLLGVARIASKCQLSESHLYLHSRIDPNGW